MCFFFQAEDGIRDHCVTGVQTCALPICAPVWRNRSLGPPLKGLATGKIAGAGGSPRRPHRSEERRVGKEGRSRRGADHEERKEGGRSDEGGQRRVDTLERGVSCRVGEGV